MRGKSVKDSKKMLLQAVYIRNILICMQHEFSRFSFIVSSSWWSSRSMQKFVQPWSSRLCFVDRIDEQTTEKINSNVSSSIPRIVSCVSDICFTLFSTQAERKALCRWDWIIQHFLSGTCVYMCVLYRVSFSQQVERPSDAGTGTLNVNANIQKEIKSMSCEAKTKILFESLVYEKRAICSVLY